MLMENFISIDKLFGESMLLLVYFLLQYKFVEGNHNVSVDNFEKITLNCVLCKYFVALMQLISRYSR